MFRKFALCLFMGLLLTGAVSAQAEAAVLLALAALTALGVYAPLADVRR